MGYPPHPPAPPPLGCNGEKKKVFTLSVTETIQHAPQGRRILGIMERRMETTIVGYISECLCSRALVEAPSGWFRMSAWRVKGT